MKEQWLNLSIQVLLDSLMYVIQCTRPDIAFANSKLSRLLATQVLSTGRLLGEFLII